jgi:hypothetical protein
MLATVIDGKRVEARALISAYTRSLAAMPRTTRRRLSRDWSTRVSLLSMVGQDGSLICDR